MDKESKVHKFVLDRGIQFQYVRVQCESVEQAEKFLRSYYPRAKVKFCPIECSQVDPDFTLPKAEVIQGVTRVVEYLEMEAES